MKPKVIIILVLLLLAIIVMIQNTQVTSFHLFFWEINMSRILFLFLALLIGFVIGYVVAKTVKLSGNV